MASQAMTDVKAAMFEQRRAARSAPPPSIEDLRDGMEKMLGALPPIPGYLVEPVSAAGVPAEWTRRESPDADSGEPAGVVLYLHGGGYFQGSLATHRRLVAALCRAGSVEGLSVDYRLAPEHRFPAAVQDAVAAYRWLVTAGGYPPQKVVVAGDSAGGGLSLALLLSLRDAGDPLPAGAYLISPWTDLAGTGGSVTTRAGLDPMIDPAGMELTARRYVGDGDLTDPLASPLYADPAGLPPLLLHVGDAEVLLDDTTRVAERATRAGVEVETEVWPEAFHVFQMMAGLLPEADEAVARAGSWIGKILAGA